VAGVCRLADALLEPGEPVFASADEVLHDADGDMSVWRDLWNLIASRTGVSSLLHTSVVLRNSFADFVPGGLFAFGHSLCGSALFLIYFFEGFVDLLSACWHRLQLAVGAWQPPWALAEAPQTACHELAPSDPPLTCADLATRAGHARDRDLALGLRRLCRLANGCGQASQPGLHALRSPYGPLSPLAALPAAAAAVGPGPRERPVRGCVRRRVLPSARVLLAACTGLLVLGLAGEVLCV
jgi:hypothetical protein